MTRESNTHDHPRHDNGEDNGGTRRVNDKQRSIAEWTTLAMSVLIVAGMIAAVSWLNFRGNEEPPVVVVEPHLDAIREDESGYYLPVTITNNGDTTVAEAMVLGELDSGEGEPETAEITIPFLAGGESVGGAFVFRSNPAEGELTTGATSYTDP